MARRRRSGSKGGVMVWDAWAYAAPSVYYMNSFRNWADPEVGADISWAKADAWDLMYPQSSSNMPYPGFCDEVVTEGLEELKAKYELELMLQEMMKILRRLR